MKEFYTIGEISKMFGVPIDTLRYYSKIGLIIPKHIGENHYRYYSIEQFEIITTVLFLRSIDTPIHKITDMLHHEDIATIQEELFQQERILQDKINHLRQLKSTVESFHSISQEFQHNSHITIEYIPTLWMLMQPFDNSSIEVNPKVVAKFHEGIKSSWLLASNMIATLSENSLYDGNYHNYSNYGLLSEFPCETESPYLTVLKDTYYVTANAKIYEINHSDVDAVYDKMLDYIHDNNLDIAGEAIERNVLDMYTGNQNDTVHFLKIYIPIKKKAGANLC